MKCMMKAKGKQWREEKGGKRGRRCWKICMCSGGEADGEEKGKGKVVKKLYKCIDPTYFIVSWKKLWGRNGTTFDGGKCE